MVSNTAKNLAMTIIKDYFHLNMESNEALSGTRVSTPFSVFRCWEMPYDLNLLVPCGHFKIITLLLF